MKNLVKCVVWDLDDTVWDGTLLEDSSVAVRLEIRAVIIELDQVGILHSIASRNSFEMAMERLKASGLAEYFLYPQIGWGAKSDALGVIAEKLNIGLDALAFVDDQAFERDEVKFNCPDVTCVDSRDKRSIESLRAIRPRFITQDSATRRQMYMSDAKRNENEERFEGPKEKFLASLQMRLRVASATVGDLQRAEELTVRTNQLNTTGLTFSYEELSQLLDSSNHLFWIAGLEDRYGSYGKIGLVLIEFTDEVWQIKLLLMSCRVMARGIGNVLINLIRGYAKQAGVRLQAGFVETDRNRMMYMTYKFSRFVEISREGSLLTLENDLHDVNPPPSYLELDISNLALPVSVPLGQAVTL